MSEKWTIEDVEPDPERVAWWVSGPNGEVLYLDATTRDRVEQVVGSLNALCALSPAVRKLVISNPKLSLHYRRGRRDAVWQRGGVMYPISKMGSTYLLDSREIAIVNATRGYSPECVAACIEAVKAGIDSDRHLERCEENQCKHCGHMAAHARKMYFDAIGLLPKE